MCVLMHTLSVYRIARSVKPGPRLQTRLKNCKNVVVKLISESSQMKQKSLNSYYIIISNYVFENKFCYNYVYINNLLLFRDIYKLNVEVGLWHWMCNNVAAEWWPWPLLVINSDNPVSITRLQRMTLWCPFWSTRWGLLRLRPPPFRQPRRPPARTVCLTSSTRGQSLLS